MHNGSDDDRRLPTRAESMLEALDNVQAAIDRLAAAKQSERGRVADDDPAAVEGAPPRLTLKHPIRRP